MNVLWVVIVSKTARTNPNARRKRKQTEKLFTREKKRKKKRKRKRNTQEAKLSIKTALHFLLYHGSTTLFLLLFLLLFFCFPRTEGFSLIPRIVVHCHRKRVPPSVEFALEDRVFHIVWQAIQLHLS